MKVKRGTSAEPRCAACDHYVDVHRADERCTFPGCQCGKRRRWVGFVIPVGRHAFLLPLARLPG